jgi:hypothetical protein
MVADIPTQAGQQGNGVITILEGQSPASSTATIQSEHASQTFTSGDITQDNTTIPSSGSTFTNNVSALGILKNLQSVLTWALHYLRPFGGNVPSAQGLE